MQKYLIKGTLWQRAFELGYLLAEIHLSRSHWSGHSKAFAPNILLISPKSRSACFHHQHTFFAHRNVWSVCNSVLVNSYTWVIGVQESWIDTDFPDSLALIGACRQCGQESRSSMEKVGGDMITRSRNFQSDNSQFIFFSFERNWQTDHSLSS